MTRLYNRHALKERRQELRNNATYAEKLLWYSLSRGKLNGKKFRRQYSVGNYILDFYCVEERLGIEVDGAVHEEKEQKEHDEIRSRYLSEIGIRVIRFKNNEVIYNTGSVIEKIKKELKK